MMEFQKRENIGWVDLLRIIACFLVVLSHCCDPFVGQFDNDRTSFLTGAFTGSFVRACVPLFVMMSGVLLFPVRLEMREFYRKRIGRIVVPLIFWSVMLPLLYYVYLNFMVSSVSPSIAPENFTMGATLTKLYTFIFNFTYDTTPLWYLYMLIGLYFIIPILNTWMEHAKQKDIRLFLRIWGISLVLPYVKMAAPLLGYTGNYGNMGLLGECDWNVLLYVRICGLFGIGILSGEISAYLELETYVRHYATDVPYRLYRYVTGLCIDPEIFSG